MQVFNQDGTHITDWPSKLIGPAVICIDDEGVAYVAEHNGGMVSILDAEGNRLAQWGDLTHRSCHGVCGWTARRICTWLSPTRAAPAGRW